MKTFAVTPLLALIPSCIWAQKIGVLPFADAANADPEPGEQVAKFIRSELEAEVSRASSGIGGISVLGQSVGSALKTVTVFPVYGRIISIGGASGGSSW